MARASPQRVNTRDASPTRVSCVGAPTERVVALVTGPVERPTRALLLEGHQGPVWSGALAQLPSAVAQLQREHPVRWVVWSAAELASVVSAGVNVQRLHDATEAHRLLAGGWSAHPGLVWAATHGLSPGSVPPKPSYDLFDSAAQHGGDRLVRADGQLRADAVHGDWLNSDDRLTEWAAALLEVAALQAELAREICPRMPATFRSESVAALLCLELTQHGLPIDRARMIELIADAAGPRTHDDQQAAAARRERDARVLAHAPGWEGTDLRNPSRVQELLTAHGIRVPNTRKWTLEVYRDTHPLVAALLDWRRAERIATTYGYRWLDDHVGPDDRLRGRWSACDGASGRMTAENGLHNLPIQLRSGVAAQPGYVFVRADLGQIEPRVLAVVSGDESLCAATASDDLYAPVAARLGVDRATAKVAVLAAMYGQRSGTAGEALKGLQSAYPVAMSVLDEAYRAGVDGGSLRTFGGRLITTGGISSATGDAASAQLQGSRGRYARNAIIQGAAAELFKAWAATVRATTADLGAEIVLCLHDELLVHVPQAHAQQVRRLVDLALTDAARRWARSQEVRFVADTSIISRWSDAAH